jgi:hypothetical protein
MLNLYRRVQVLTGCLLADRNKEAAVAAGAFDPLGKLLSHDVEDVKHQASMCLDTLLSNYQNRLALKKSQHSTIIIEGCLQLLHDVNAIGQENARCRVLQTDLVS